MTLYCPFCGTPHDIIETRLAGVCNVLNEPAFCEHCTARLFYRIAGGNNPGSVVDLVAYIPAPEPDALAPVMANSHDGPEFGGES